MLEALVLAGGLVPLAAMILVLFAVSRVRRCGPGRFQNALVAALDEGRIRRAGRGRCEAAKSGE